MTEDITKALEKGCRSYVDSFEKNWLNNPQPPHFDRRLSVPYRWCKEAINMIDKPMRCKTHI